MPVTRLDGCDHPAASSGSSLPAPTVSAWLFLLLTAAYYAGAQLGLLLALPGTNVGMVYVPVGMMVAVTMRYGYRVWPVAALGACAADLPYLLQNHPVGVATAIAAGQILADVSQILLGVYAYFRLGGGRNPLDRVSHVVSFVLLAAVASQALGATIGTGSLWVGGALPSAQYGSAWLAWWTSNMISVLVITPFVLTWLLREQADHAPTPSLSHGSMFAFAGLAGLALLLSTTPLSHRHFEQLAFSFAVWSIFVLSQRGVTATLLIIAFAELSRTSLAAGTLIAGSVDESTVTVGTFLVILSVTTMILCAMASERRRTGEEMRVAHEQLANIIECLPDPAFVVGIDGKVIAWNQAMVGLSGVPKDQMLGQGDYAYAVPFYGRRQPILVDFVGAPPDEEDPAYKFVKTVGDKVFAESFLPGVGGGAGSHLWGVAAPLYDGTGARCGAIEVIRDVTDRVEAHEHLRASNRKARAVFDLSLAFLGLLSPDGTVLEMNRTALEFAGLQVGDVVGRPFWQTAWWLHSTEAQERVRSAIQAAAAGEIVRFEATVRATDGTARVIDCSLKPVHDEAGKVLMLIPEGRDITVRKQTERALDLERRFFEALFESLPGYAFVLDEEGRYVRCNRNLEQAYGRSLVGTSFFDEQSHVLPAHRPLLRSVLQEAFVSGRASAEYVSLSADGSEVPRFTTGQVFVLDGKRYGVGVSFDISERVKAEEALRASERRLELALDLACGGVWEVNLETAVAQMDARLLHRLGYSAGELPGTPDGWFSLQHPDDELQVRSAFDALARGARHVHHLEYRIRRKDGSWAWIESHGMVVDHAEDGRPTRILGVGIDITERKQAETHIRHLKNYLANIIDSMPSLIVGIDRNNVVTQWNRRAEEVTGVPASQAIGQLVETVLPSFVPWITALREEMVQCRPVSMERAVRIEDGHRRFFDLMLYPLVANGIDGAVLRIEDATERARIQDLMLQTEKMMSVGGLAAGMAHEINNPLGIITQAVQNIERRVSPSLAANQKAAEALGLNLDLVQAYFDKREICQFIRDIREASCRAGRIVGNMLQFSRRSESARQCVSLAEILDRTVELAASDYDLRKRFDFRDIEIAREYEPDLPPVPIVMVEIEQVLLNLLKNAAQAMTPHDSPRKPRIVLRLRREEKYAVIEVEDNGPGIEPSVLHRVFEPFFTTKSPDLGTGLGLSVSYTIVTQNHNGQISVESIPGQGARFIVKLPLEATGEP